MFKAASVSALTAGSFGSKRPVMGSGTGVGREARGFSEDVASAIVAGWDMLIPWRSD